MTESTAVKKDTQRLQRAIVEGLEDVKAQDIQVFNTEHLSPLFERVIVASGTSNRQTKALAASVRDAVREAGFAKPRIEGEDNGEWIIVDCGAAVAHIMQPAIRGYYQLEEIWGEKPVRLKLGAPKPAMASSAKSAPSGDGAAKKKPASPSLRRSSAALKGQRAADAAAKEGKPARKGSGKPASKAPVKAAAKPASKSATKKVTQPATPASAASRLAAGKAVPAKKAPTKSVPAKSAAKSAAKPASKSAAKPAAKKAAPAAKKSR